MQDNQKRCMCEYVFNIKQKSQLQDWLNYWHTSNNKGTSSFTSNT